MHYALDSMPFNLTLGCQSHFNRLHLSHLDSPDSLHRCPAGAGQCSGAPFPSKVTLIRGSWSTSTGKTNPWPEHLKTLNGERPVLVITPCSGTFQMLNTEQSLLLPIKPHRYESVPASWSSFSLGGGCVSDPI